MSEAVEDLNTPLRYSDTLPPDQISDELEPIIEELGLRENCRQLAMQGWTVIDKPTSEAFNTEFRNKIKELCPQGGGNMLLAKDPLFAEVVMNPYLMALAEYSVGRGFLISQVAASIRGEGAQSIGLHADNNWLPAPFPDHNMLMTACWATDGYTKAGGSTLVIPGSNVLHRHPTDAEVEGLAGAIPIECSPGSIVIWDGNLWHSNYPRTAAGERVVCHITYARLMMRPVEDYSAHADQLIDAHGEKMSYLLGREDMLNSPTGADYSKLLKTFNNAKR